MRIQGSRETLEWRRRRALVLVDEGFSLNEVGRIIGCAPSSVMRWRDRRQEGGDEALVVRFSPGRTPKLSAKQKKKLEKILLAGPLASRYRTDLWTCARVAEVIERNFGVSYHPDHVGKLLRQMGWSHQKPEKRALKRSQQEVERWLLKEWPRVKKTPANWVPISYS